MTSASFVRVSKVVNCDGFVLTSPGGAPSTNEEIVFSCEDVILIVKIESVTALRRVLLWNLLFEAALVSWFDIWTPPVPRQQNTYGK